MKAKSLIKIPSKMIDNFHAKLEKKMASKYKNDPANLTPDSKGKVPYFECTECADAYEDYYYETTPNPSRDLINLLNVLIKFWNKSGRETVFCVDTKTLLRKTYMGESALRNSRNELVRRGICAYVPGTKNCPGFYQLVDFRYYYLVGFSEMKPFEIDSQAYKTSKAKFEKSQKKEKILKAYAELKEDGQAETNVYIEQDLTEKTIDELPEIPKKSCEIKAEMLAENVEDGREIPVNTQAETKKYPVSDTGKKDSSYIERYRDLNTESICPNFKKSEQIQEEDEANTDATLNTLSQDVFSSLQDQWSAAFQGAHIHSSRRRMKKLQNLLKEFGADQVREAIHKVFASRFLMGNIPLREREGGFKLKVDFILDRSNFVKILEGLYDDETYGTRPTCENINKSNLTYEGYSKKEFARDQQYTKNQQDDYDWFYGLGEFADTEEETCAACENNNDEVLKAAPVIKSTEPMPANQAEPTTRSIEDTSDEDWFYSVGWALA